MLKLRRRIGEQIVCLIDMPGEQTPIEVVITHLGGNGRKVIDLGIDAPACVRILRRELLDAESGEKIEYKAA